MISSPVLYIFILAVIATFFSTLKNKTSFKIFKFIPAVLMIYVFSMLLALFGAFEHNQEIDSIYKLTKTNLLPAMLFLMLLQIDFKHIFKRASFGEIGCACSIGAKRYWFLIFLSVVVSLLSQLLATYIEFLNTTLTIILFSMLFGVLGSFSRLRYINGSNEVATTMLYVFIALIGSKAVF